MLKSKLPMQCPFLELMASHTLNILTWKEVSKEGLPTKRVLHLKNLVSGVTCFHPPWEWKGNPQCRASSLPLSCLVPGRRRLRPKYPGKKARAGTLRSKNDLASSIQVAILGFLASAVHYPSSRRTSSPVPIAKRCSVPLYAPSQRPDGLLTGV